ncbi:MAG: EamA family transporter RarD [Hellea sp.]|nr:EamA family transporter RarD [Hellea sp.]
MSGAPSLKPDNSGLYAGITAYMIWGIFPIYFKITQEIPAMEILTHRIFWSVPFGLLILIFRCQIKDVLIALKKFKTILLLAIAAIAMASNWGVYIWAVQQDQIFQGSLGYYMNPLMYVLVGVVFFGEKLTRNQALAVVLAAIGVLVLTFYGGEFPAIALFLGVSFTIYGVVRKQVDIGAMPGLFIETLILLVPGLAYMIYLQNSGQFAFFETSTNMQAWLVFAGPLTVAPLLAFAYAARRLTLTMLGFLQYIGPTMQFMCALYYGEKFTAAHAFCFGCIWIAVALFSWDRLKNREKPIAAEI